MTIRSVTRKLSAVASAPDRFGGRFLLLAALTGVAVGLGAWALVGAIEVVESALEALDIGDRPWLLLVVMPAGFLAAWAIARYYAPEVAGDGVPEAAASLAVSGGRIRGRVGPAKVIATAFTLGAGGSAGREGPIVLIGASAGSKLASLFNLGEDQVRSLVAAGAAAGIGASFNAPIAGMLFAMEVILSSFAIRHMSAVVIASVAAAITSGELVGEELNSAVYSLNHPAELVLYGLLAIVITGFAVFFLRFLDKVERWVHTSGRDRNWLRPVGFGVVTAALVLAEPLLMGTDTARLAGTGQEVTQGLLATATAVSDVTSEVSALWWMLGLVALGKVVATVFTFGGGGSGGAFMPSLFIGAMVGTAFAQVAGSTWTVSELSTGSFAVVGMATMFSAMARAPLTAILLVFEVTGVREYGLILPLMLAAVVATLLTERLSADSVYTMALSRRGIPRTRTGEVDVLDTVQVGEVMAPPQVVVGLHTPLAEVQAELDRHRSHGVPVVDAAGGLAGIVTVTDILSAGGSHTALVSDVMTARPITATPGTRVSEAMARMASLGVGRLPVVAEDDPSRLVGLFRREDAVRAYHRALGSQTDHALQRARLAQRIHPGSGYFDFRVPPGSMADGRAVRDVNWPEGSTLVSVRRGLDVIVPVGPTVLRRGDVVTAFGNDAARSLVIERLNASADVPTAEVDLVDTAELPVIGDDDDR